MSEETVYSKGSAAVKGLANCHACGLLNPIENQYCTRCHAKLHLRKPHSLQSTLALVITAIILYLPANLLPIMSTSTLGSTSAKTILGGVKVFVHSGDYPIALVIFIASVVIPVAKLFALSWLCYSVHRLNQSSPKQRTKLYKLTELIGRWSMVDVFVVAILVALVQLGNIMTITPGPAALAFSAVVIITMIAASSFDPRLIWDTVEKKQKGHDAKNH